MKNYEDYVYYYEDDDKEIIIKTSTTRDNSLENLLADKKMRESRMRCQSPVRLIIHDMTCLTHKNDETAEPAEPAAVYSYASGLDYPGVGSQHLFIADDRRVNYETVTDQEIIVASFELSRMECIIPAH